MASAKEYDYNLVFTVNRNKCDWNSSDVQRIGLEGLTKNHLKAQLFSEGLGVRLYLAEYEEAYKLCIVNGKYPGDPGFIGEAFEIREQDYTSVLKTGLVSTSLFPEHLRVTVKAMVQGCQESAREQQGARVTQAWWDQASQGADSAPKPEASVPTVPTVLGKPTVVAKSGQSVEPR
jgi:hypothetical protein